MPLPRSQPAERARAVLEALLLVVLAGTLLVAAPSDLKAHDRKPSREIHFPDIEGFLTLSVDLHTHSVFSDGEVWPSVRVQEAVRDNLDALAITEHLEYQPHAADIPHPDRNRAFELAQQSAAETDLLLIPGAEVTRDMPVGHINAVFIQDANRLLDRDPVRVLAEANRQGAFLFWNHPNWLGQRIDGTVLPSALHLDWIKKGQLHGVEVVNHTTYSDGALAFAKEMDLTVIGSSDIHGVIDWLYDTANGGHRPVTLVYATERTLQGIREGLDTGRTVAYFGDLLAGTAQNLQPLLQAMVEVDSFKYQVYGMRLTTVFEVEFSNRSGARIVLENASPYNLHDRGPVSILEPFETQLFQFKTREALDEVVLDLRILSAILPGGEHPTIQFRLQRDSASSPTGS